MGSSISGQIAKFHALSRKQLLDLWQELYGKSTPHGIRRELIIPFLAYRLQERACGGLKTSTRTELRRIARSFKRTSGSAELKVRPRIKPGTRLVRQWRGATHEVTVSESSYEYRGVSYSSLSRIARKITGTRWSGPAFFGLNGANSVSGRRHD
jgi:hypothetical protein